MRRLNLTTAKPAGMSLEEWIGEAFQQINEAAQEQAAENAVEAIDFADGDVTEVTSFNPSSASATDMRNVVSTFLMYLRRGGPSKTQ